ncbi:chloride channel protein [Subtercola sp. RTI3]|uniref:chloride channel protein n=1 Tax=Subtercola sp. RTI3 TaxID=3048639 RepID=UPI002B222A2B|nr:chloride channel protein [Subtercola sp. RTI3]MEA9983836.1 chloride channel protein [Subtercola sp. RTI3]
MVEKKRDVRSALRGARAWLRGSRFGLLTLALIVGVGAGLGAVAFRYLVYAVTWLFTGQVEFGQDGWVTSSHLPWLGLSFYVVIPVVGGLLYGPLVYFFAREARGHGVPEVMVAVAVNGGRIRPQVAIVKAFASALTIGTGGSVGREGPIVQIGSAMASSLGQWLRMPEHRMRILVACGAAGGIAATFNAPITGVFFVVEIIIREISVDSLFAVMLSAMVADAVAIQFLGNSPFLADFPHGLALGTPKNYLLVAVLAVIAALIGIGFTKALYAIEDLCDRLWRGRPEWARPAVGGIFLGLLLLGVPQLFGVGYPVMFNAVAGDYSLWFLLILAGGKVLATSLTLGIGGSGGIFAPSLFIGLMTGTAFGIVADHLFGPAAGDPALYAAIGMAAVFSSATRAPLTSLASVVELTGDFTLTLPVMLTVGISTALSRGISYGTIYTTKLIRRGQDLDRAAPWRAFSDLTAKNTMRRLPSPTEIRTHDTPDRASDPDVPLPGTFVVSRTPQSVFETEPLPDVLRQLEAYPHTGLPVLSEDATTILGWVSTHSIVASVARELTARSGDSVRSAAPSSNLRGFHVLEVSISAESDDVGRTLGSLTWPRGHIPVSVARGGQLGEADPSMILVTGDHINVLAPG